MFFEIEDSIRALSNIKEIISIPKDRRHSVRSHKNKALTTCMSDLLRLKLNEMSNRYR